MLLIIVMATVVAVGLVAVARAEPRPRYEAVIWNDATERRLLHERELHAGGW